MHARLCEAPWREQSGLGARCCCEPPPSPQRGIASCSPRQSRHRHRLRTRSDVLQRRRMDGQQAHEEMVYTTSHQGNAHQNSHEVPPHAERPPSRVYREQILERVWRAGKSGGAATMENSVQVPRKVKNKAITGSSNSTSENASKGNENTMFTRYLHRPQCSQRHCFQSPSYRNNPCPPTDKQIKTWCVHAVEQNSAGRTEEILPFAATRMDPEGTMLSGVSQREKAMP